MSRDDIIKLTYLVGAKRLQEKNRDTEYLVSHEQLERFAAFVAAAEREKVAAWMIQRSYATGHGDTTEDLLKELDWQIAERIAAEREACARICETEWSTTQEHVHGLALADMIRDRGQQ